MGLLAVDIDGTVTENGGGAVHLGALASLRRLARAGHSVVFVSGRSSVEGHVLSVFGGTGSLAVGENGGCITYGPAEHRVLGDLPACEAAFEALRSGMGAARKRAFPRMSEVVVERGLDVGRARGLLAEGGHEVSLSDSGYACHINSAGVDKGSGLREAASMLSEDLSSSAAIGDSETDVPMFGAAAASVALGNAPGPVREGASARVRAGGGEGVLEAIDALGPTIAGWRR